MAGDAAAHAAALLGLLRAVTVPNQLVVFDGAEPDPAPAPPYVVAYVNVETTGQSNVTGQSDRVVARIYCHSIGARTGDAARVVSDRVRGALLNKKVTVAGRESGLIRHESSVPPQRDNSTGTPVFDQVDVYRVETWPA